MPRLQITATSIIITFNLFERLLSWRRELRVSFDHVDGVGPGSYEVLTRRRFQDPGVWAPGTIMSGIFINEEGRTLWCVYDIEKAVAIYFNGEEFLAAVIQVEDPDATTAALTRAVALYRSNKPVVP